MIKLQKKTQIKQCFDKMPDLIASGFLIPKSFKWGLMQNLKSMLGQTENQIVFNLMFMLITIRCK